MSRRTFRPAAGDKAWQRQLRERYEAEGAPDVDLTLRRSVVRPVTYAFARQIILKYEWLGTMNRSRHHFGIFFGPYCAGVTCVAVGTGTGGIGVAGMFGLQAQQELAVLVRGACVHWAPSGANSRLVSWTCRLLAQQRTARLIVAYSDTDAGEVGTIYQAANWTYIGMGAEKTQFVAPNGRIYDEKLPYDLRRAAGTLDTVTWAQQRDALLAAGWTEQTTNPKHRYACVLDRSDRRLLDTVERMRLPYPKRSCAGSSERERPAHQQGGDGELPIPALHTGTASAP